MLLHTRIHNYFKTRIKRKQKTYTLTSDKIVHPGVEAVPVLGPVEKAVRVSSTQATRTPAPWLFLREVLG